MYLVILLLSQCICQLIFYIYYLSCIHMCNHHLSFNFFGFHTMHINGLYILSSENLGYVSNLLLYMFNSNLYLYIFLSLGVFMTLYISFCITSQHVIFFILHNFILPVISLYKNQCQNVHFTQLVIFLLTLISDFLPKGRK